MIVSEKNLYGDPTAMRAHIKAAEKAEIYVLFKHLQRKRRNAIAAFWGTFFYVAILFLFCGVV